MSSYDMKTLEKIIDDIGLQRMASFNEAKLAAQKDWPEMSSLYDFENESTIDFSRGIVVSIDAMSSYDTKTLEKIIVNLGLQKEVAHVPHWEKRDYMMNTIKSFSKGNSMTTEIEGLSDVIVIGSNKDGTIGVSLYQNGGVLRTLEGREKGHLVFRCNYCNGSLSSQKEWTKEGDLKLFRLYDDSGFILGPSFEVVPDHRSEKRRTARYHLHGKNINREKWLQYIEESKQLVRNASFMVKGVDELIISYAQFQF